VKVRPDSRHPSHRFNRQGVVEGNAPASDKGASEKIANAKAALTSFMKLLLLGYSDVLEVFSKAAAPVRAASGHAAAAPPRA
jgi:hypothetical protein